MLTQVFFALAGLTLGIATHHYLLFVLLPLFALIYAFTRTRLDVFIFALFYFATASFDIIEGHKTFTNDDSYTTGFILWLIANSLLAASFIIVKNKTHAFPAGLVISALLPFGWASALNAAGVYYPSLSVVGFILMFALLTAIANKNIQLSALLLAVSFIANIAAKPVLLDDNTIAINTNQPPYSADKTITGRIAWQEKQVKNFMAQQKQCSEDGLTYVLPESSIGVVENWNLKLWNDVAAFALCENDKLVVNGEIGITNSQFFAFDNATMVFTKKGLTASYPARASVPGVNPARWHLAKNENFLVCYELYLVWPNLLANFGSNDVVIAQANLWWTDKNNSLVKIQSETGKAYARLFSNGFYLSTNM